MSPNHGAGGVQGADGEGREDGLPLRGCRRLHERGGRQVPPHHDGPQHQIPHDGRDPLHHVRADMRARGRGFQDVPSVPCGLRHEHPHRQGRVHQRRVLLPGPRRHLDRRRVADRPAGRHGHPRPRPGPRAQARHVPGSDTHRQERLDRRPCDDPPERHDRRRRRRRRGRGGDEGRTAEHGRRRCASESREVPGSILALPMRMRNRPTSFNASIPIGPGITCR